MITYHEDHSCKEGKKKLLGLIELLNHISKRHAEEQVEVKVFFYHGVQQLYGERERTAEKEKGEQNNSIFVVVVNEGHVYLVNRNVYLTGGYIPLKIC